LRDDEDPLDPGDLDLALAPSIERVAKGAVEATIETETAADDQPSGG
jgi:segregation and condensation protein B